VDEAARPAPDGPPALTSLLLGFLALSPAQAAALGITGRVINAESGAGGPSAQVALLDEGEVHIGVHPDAEV
jgi:hypothetical protein